MSRALRVSTLVLAAFAAVSIDAQENETAEMLVVPPVETRDTVPAATENDTAPAKPLDEKQAAEPTEAEAPTARQATDEDVTPPPFPVSRYATLWERSPFQLESIAPPTQSEGLAQRYALTGIAQINNEPIIFLLERATQLRHMLDKKTNTAGLSLVQIDMKDKYAESTAVVRQGEEVGVVKFDPTTPLQSMPSAPVAPQGARPPRVMSPGMTQPSIPGQGATMPGIPVPGSNPSQPNPLQTPQGAVAMPGVVPAVPGPTPDSGDQVQPPGTSSNPAQPRVIRRRALIPAAP